MTAPGAVSPVVSSEAVSRAYQTVILWGGRLVSRLQNRTLAVLAFLVTTVVGCVIGGVVAPFITRPSCDAIDEYFKNFPHLSKTYKLCVGSVVFFTFGLVVLAVNYWASKLLQLPVSPRMFMAFTITPPALFAFCTAYYHENTK